MVMGNLIAFVWSKFGVLVRDWQISLSPLYHGIFKFTEKNGMDSFSVFHSSKGAKMSVRLNSPVV
jgi:hypothetical protein